MQEIRLGTVGSGSIVHHILDAVSVVDGIRCAVVYSRSQEKGTALAADYHVPRVYTDYGAMLSDSEINCVYIASPNSLHYPQMMQALHSGKHVICEKPLCPTAQEVREAVALAEEKHLLLAEAVPTLHLANYSCLKDALPLIGKVREASLQYGKYSSRYDALLSGNIPNVFSLQYAGGCLADINYYNLYLCAALWSMPDSLEYAAEIYPGAADTSGMATLHYGEMAVHCYGAKDRDIANYVRIVGDQGQILIPDGSNGIREVQIRTANGTEIRNPDLDRIPVDIRDYLASRTKAESNPFRWYLEIQSLTELFLAEDRDTLRRLLNVSEAAAAMTELGRCSAGIQFR